MLEFSTLAWFAVGLSAFLAGFSKTGMPCAGVLAVPLVASVMPARQSVGFLLPILCLADIMAVIYWRRHADWPKLIKLMPWAFVGIVIGFYCLGRINDQQLMLVIGLIVLILLAVNYWRNRRPDQQPHIPNHWLFAAVMGLLAGTTTMLANAAGPIMAIYLLAMRLDKKQFLGTGAWYFFIMNLVKVPFSGKLDLITTQSFLTNLALLPAILLGGLAGIILVNRIPTRLFNRIVTILAALTALTLLIRGGYQLTT